MRASAQVHLYETNIGDTEYDDDVVVTAGPATKQRTAYGLHYCRWLPANPRLRGTGA
jgi:hypothetical protein